jgi:hypothetical protein
MNFLPQKQRDSFTFHLTQGDEENSVHQIAPEEMRCKDSGG